MYININKKNIFGPFEGVKMLTFLLVNPVGRIYSGNFLRADFKFQIKIMCEILFTFVKLDSALPHKTCD